MKWMGVYLVGYVVLVAGVLAALWKLDVLGRLGAGWTAIGLVVALGAGIMLAVAKSGTKESIQIEK